MRTFPQNFPSKEAAERVLWTMACDGHADMSRDDRLRALVLLATFASLRWGEVIALHRRDIDTDARTVTVRRQYLEMDSGDLVIGPTKSRAGSRTVVIPAAIVSAIRVHLDRYVESDPAALVFTGANGGILRRGNFRRASRWAEVVEALGVPGLHFHDLRHTGNTIAAQSGASLRDLMDRMGHDSVRAAMIYQHGTSEAGKAIADSLNDRIAAAVGSGEDDQGKDDDGASGVLVPVA
ncbi:site-specific integrase [Actinomadura sp. HBU206391]|nr:site-specific integrase [Actinomadura sp. HBU206391]